MLFIALSRRYAATAAIRTAAITVIRVRLCRVVHPEQITLGHRGEGSWKVHQVSHTYMLTTGSY